jgi:hypothetical protein
MDGRLEGLHGKDVEIGMGGTEEITLGKGNFS